jgi:hypothetical protein
MAFSAFSAAFAAWAASGVVGASPDSLAMGVCRERGLSAESWKKETTLHAKQMLRFVHGSVLLSAASAAWTAGGLVGASSDSLAIRVYEIGAFGSRKGWKEMKAA